MVDKSVSGYELEQIKNLILYQFWHDYDLPDFHSRFSGDHHVGHLIKHYQGLRVMRDWNLFWRLIEGYMHSKCFCKANKDDGQSH